MKPEIVKIYLLGGSDGYTHTFTQHQAVLTPEEAEEYTSKSGYCISDSRWAVKLDNKYYLIDDGAGERLPVPLTMGLKTESEEDRKKKAALAKLTHAERKLLGLESYDL